MILADKPELWMSGGCGERAQTGKILITFYKYASLGSISQLTHNQSPKKQKF
jgi:hypothetical protein